MHNHCETSLNDSVEQIEGSICSVNMSSGKGTTKTPTPGKIVVDVQHGISGDAHAGDWHRQVSFLAAESINKAKEAGLNVSEGSFGENFTTSGIDLKKLTLGSRLQLGDEVLVEISQIGKVCHTRCAIYYAAGDCIFPREGIFGVVLQGGIVETGDTIKVVKQGDGTCLFTPTAALEEVELARSNGTL